MNIIEDMNPNEEWKRHLREKFIILMTGSEQEKQSLYADIGYVYQCYAPASVYKYYSDNTLNLNALKTNRMWYSAPCVFNNVFDCDVTVDEDKLFKSIQSYPGMQGVRIGSPMWKQMRTQAKSSAKGMRDMFAQMRSQMGITCLSESDESLLMWAHYANNHCGMCVEYELMEINRQLKFTPIPIIYSEERACLDSLNPETVERDTTKVFLESLTSKSLEWSYEKEWRIIRDDSACGDRWDAEKKGALLDMIRPISVTLGCMAKLEFSKEVQEYCENNQINLYKMERDPKAYRLVKTPILQFDD